MPTHTQCCQRCWMVVFVVWHGCMLVLQHTWCHGQSPPPPPLCVVAILSPRAMPCHACHAHQTMSTGVQCQKVWCQLSTHLTNLFVACIAWWVLCGGVLVHTGLDATPPVVHTMGCNALVCCHQCLCVALCALPSIVSTTTTTTLLHHWCVCGWSTPGQRCCWAVC